MSRRRSRIENVLTEACLQVKKDLFHMLQIYDRNMQREHKMAKTCRNELDAVFFGSPDKRTKQTRVPPGPDVAKALQDWYDKWSGTAGLFKSSMAAKHKLQLQHVRDGCVSDPPDMKVRSLLSAELICCPRSLFVS